MLESPDTHPDSKDPNTKITFSPGYSYFAATGKSGHTAIYQSSSLKMIAKYKIACKLISFQLETGNVAMVPESRDNVVLIWDFKRNKTVYEADFIKSIRKISYVRNLVLAASDDRLIIHDLSRKQHCMYLPMMSGSTCIINGFYESLKIAFQLNQAVFRIFDVWANRYIELQQLDFEKGCFDYRGDKMMLIGKEKIFVYWNTCLTNIIPYDKQRLVECIFDSQLLEETQGIILVSKAQNGYDVEWKPIFRADDGTFKRKKFKYEFKYEQILAEDLKDIGCPTMVYFQNGDLCICNQGQEVIVYERIEIQ